MQGYEGFETYTFPSAEMRRDYADLITYSSGVECELKISEDVNDMHSMYFLHVKKLSKTLKERLSANSEEDQTRWYKRYR